MISVQQAWDEIARVAPSGKIDTVALSDAAGRILAEPILAQRSQPPRDVSAMDGYGVRFEAIAEGQTQFTVIGEVAAGQIFNTAITSTQAVRIFTGAPVSPGVTHVIVQEDTERDGDRIQLTQPQDKPSHIRKAGQDFKAGELLLPVGQRLSPADVALIANANYAKLAVLTKPRVAFIASGDEIVAPGQALGAAQIPDSLSAALAAMVEIWGGTCVASCRTPDDRARFAEAVQSLPEADILVPIGGASVGDYDYAKQVFYGLGFTPVFEKIAVKPGKPCWFAKSDTHLALGLPGNPSSAMVTARLFLQPLMAQWMGAAASQDWMTARLSHALAANGARETYLRGTWKIDENGVLRVQTSPRQDSALTQVFAQANCLLRREAHGPGLKIDDKVELLPL